MAKIDPGFAYDGFRFLIQSLRAADTDGILERYFGAMQAEFERTHARIQQIPEIADIALVEDELLQYLKWIVGWSDERELSFVNDLTNDQLRKLIKLSVPMWKSKGTRQGLVNAIRIFTGKSTGFRSWFDSRFIMDEAGLWFTGVVDDPWIAGGIYTGDDETLSWLFINRVGLDDDAKRLLYDLTSYIVPLNEHYGIVYCAFFDDFLDNTLNQWVIGGDPITITSGLRALMPANTSMSTNVVPSELETWTPFQRVEVTVATADNNASTVFRVSFMRDELTGQEYRASLQADGVLSLHGWDGAAYQLLATNSSVVLPVGDANGTQSFLIACTVDPVNDAENLVTISVNGQIEISYTATLNECLRTSTAGVKFANDAGGGDVFVDNVVIQASPWHGQQIGQRTLIDQGQIANPDPGVEVFVATPDVRTLDPYIVAEYCTQSEWNTWTIAGLWQKSNFSALCDSDGLWFGQNGVGVFPNQSVDMDYIGAASASARSPSLDLSGIDPAIYDVKVRVWYRPNKVAPSPGSPEAVTIRYDIGGPAVAFGTFETANTELSRVEPDADPRIGDGRWWEQEDFSVPAAALTAATEFVIRFGVSGTYTSTDFGFGVTLFQVIVTRK